MPPERETEFCRNIRNHNAFRLNRVTGRWDWEDSCELNRPQLCKLYRRHLRAHKDRKQLLVLRDVVREHAGFGDYMLDNIRKRLHYLQQLDDDEEDAEEIRLEKHLKMQSVVKTKSENPIFEYTTASKVNNKPVKEEPSFLSSPVKKILPTEPVTSHDVARSMQRPTADVKSPVRQLSPPAQRLSPVQRLSPERELSPEMAIPSPTAEPQPEPEPMSDLDTLLNGIDPSLGFDFPADDSIF